MSTKIKYPILKWSEPEYWGKIFVLLVFIIIVNIASYYFFPYKYVSQKVINFYAAFVYSQILILYAIHERQKLLLQYMDAIMAIIEDDVMKRLINTKDRDQYRLPSWNFYYHKLKRLIKYFCNFLLIYAIPIFLLIPNKNLAFKIGSAPSLIFLFVWFYIKSIYLMDYLKNIIQTYTSILSDIETITTFDVNWEKYDKKIQFDRILSLLIISFTFIFYLLNIIDFFYGTVTLIWFAFLYPSIRLTIYLNLLFNRFSSSVEKDTLT